jgi:hypothetical protein
MRPKSSSVTTSLNKEAGESLSLVFFIFKRDG